MADQVPAQDGIDGDITVTFNGNVAIVTMNRGQNRLNPSFFDAMNDALDKVESNPDVQVMITTGRGRFYSNGLDLDFLGHKSQQATAQDFLEQFGIRFQGLLLRLVEFPLVTVAAINGHAYAGGAILALNHDYRIMNTDKGWFCLNEVHLGLHFAPFLQEMIKMRLPSGRVFMEAAVLGRRYTADEAKADNIVEAVCSENNLVKTAANCGRSILPKNGFRRKYLQDMKKNVLGRRIRALKNDPGIVKSGL